jgi:uncharacterized repeat protein (TIGR04076 family)
MTFFPDWSDRRKRKGVNMKRRDFFEKSGCAFAGMASAPLLSFAQEKSAPRRRQYKIDIEIYEAREDTWCHKKGDRFSYPADWGKICPWLRASLVEFVRILEHGVSLTWKYENTPYEKVIDPAGVTTEYVRCPDPTADLVAKITRTAV